MIPKYLQHLIDPYTVISTEGECEIGNWPKNRDGYGQKTLTFDGKKRTLRQHREVWEKLFGPIPEGLQVLHHCDNPGCIRPIHLYLGTPKNNAQDRSARSRNAEAQPGYTHPMKGKLHSDQAKQNMKAGWARRNAT